MPLSEITREHFERMIRDGIPESRELDYKQARPLGNEAGKKEFLKDITAFANTIGGHMVIGLAEDGGVPTGIVEITDTTADDEKLRLKNLIRDGVQPGLLGVEMHEVALDDGGFGLVIRVPRSWNPPHRVSLGGVNKFYLRNSSGADEMDVEQLRGVFFGGAELGRRIREFRDERLTSINNGTDLARVPSGNRFIIHILPAGRMVGDSDVIASTRGFVPLSWNPRLAGQAYNTRFNMDGVLSYLGTSSQSAEDYTQLYRDGRVEYVVGNFVLGPASSGNLVINRQFIRDSIVNIVPDHINYLARWGFSAPFFVMVSLQGAHRMSMGGQAGDRAEMKFEPLLIEGGSYEPGGVQWARMVKPLLDAIWNAFGHPRCDIL